VFAKRMLRELRDLESLEDVVVRPHGDNLAELHYVVKGPKNSPYAGGFFWGVLKFPPTYPMAPPSILMFTPSGRFKPNTRLCLSVSDFHAETWSPLWGAGTILKGLVSFMCEDTPTLGSIEASFAARRQFAADSLQFNERDPVFRAIFPDVLGDFANSERRRSSSASSASSASSPSSASEPGPIIANPPAPAAVAKRSVAKRRRWFRMPLIDVLTYVALLAAGVFAAQHWSLLSA
jgi:ubiquitin-conjugating enzyme E2 J2